MAEIINLKRFRKTKARARKERDAEENRLRFGRTKAERQREEAARKSTDRTLDGSRIEPCTPDANDTTPD